MALTKDFLARVNRATAPNTVASSSDHVPAAESVASEEFHERVRPALNFYRLFGLGLRHASPETHGALQTAADVLLLAANAALCAYGFAHVTFVVRENMPMIWDATTVMHVAKVYTYLLSPMVTLAAWQWYGRAIARAARALHADGLHAVPLWPYVRRIAAWYALSILTEAASYTLFHASTSFAFFLPHEYALIALYNVWTVAPVHAYVALVDAVRLAVSHINGRVTTVAAWRTHRGPWKRLTGTAVRLARREFGLVIVMFVVRSIAEMVFYSFTIYYVSFPFPFWTGIPSVIYACVTLFSIARMFEVFRVTHNCKQEILKTQKILSVATYKTKSDYKELKYFSLYMLHMDLNFMPYGIFEISYRNFLTIATLATAFAVFQIQMKLH